jgi:hypothetical protein
MLSRTLRTSLFFPSRNVSHKRADHTSELITLPRQHHLLLSITMSQLPDLESLSRADRLILAI